MEARNSPSQKKEPTDENLDALQPSQLIELLPTSDALKLVSSFLLQLDIK